MADDVETMAENSYTSEPPSTRLHSFSFVSFKCRELSVKTPTRFDEKNGLRPKPFTASGYTSHPCCTGAPVNHTRRRCPVASCGQKYIAPDCQHRRYLATTTNFPPLFFLPLPLLSRSVVQFLYPCQLRHHPSPLSVLASLDAHSNLRYAPRTPAVQRERELELAEAQRRTDAEQIAYKAKRSVIVC